MSENVGTESNSSFDAGFEKYIIFHRGVAEASVQADGHLHIKYQDGVDQDLGDPLGSARQDIDAAKTAAEEYNAKKAEMDALVESLDKKLENYGTAGDIADAVNDAIGSIPDKVGEAVNKAVTDIDGLIYDKESGKYSVDFEGNKTLENNINDSIKGIAGVAEVDGEYVISTSDVPGLNAYVQNIVNTALQGVTGIEMISSGVDAWKFQVSDLGLKEVPVDEIVEMF